MSEHGSFPDEPSYLDDEDSSSGIGVVRIASVAALGGFLFGYDSAVINGGVSAIEDQFAVDLTDNQGNTAEGMHIASAGGTWQILVNGFGGLRILGGQVTLNPWLPTDWEGIRFRIRWRGRPIRVAVLPTHVELLLGGPSVGARRCWSAARP